MSNLFSTSKEIILLIKNGYPKLKYMKNATFLLLLLLANSYAAELAGKRFLKFVYGDESVVPGTWCANTNDLWMLQKPKDENMLRLINSLPEDRMKEGVMQGIVGMDLYFFEVKNDVVDPAFSLEVVYAAHRRLILEFLVGCAVQDRFRLQRLSTDASKIVFESEKIISGEMGQFREILERFPIVRVSRREDELTSKSLTYRIPIGRAGLPLNVVRKGKFWTIYTDKGLPVSFAFFSEKAPSRPVEYAP